MASSSTTVSTGPEVVGRYVVYEAIASGGQASVHYGRLSGAEGFGRTVAVKRLKLRDDQDADIAVKALIDEARLSSRITHPNVVQTLDLVEHEGELLVVMEYVHGETVSKLLKAAADRRQPVPPDIATAIIAGALRGLVAAHTASDEQGGSISIIHRDISPQNIIVDVHGHARVLDFGIAKAPGRSQDTTETGSIKGKPAYMAPEQLRGKVTVRVDLWATGTVLWELLTGKRLFSGKTDEEVITRVLTEPAPAPSTLRAGISDALDAVVLKALEPDADRRFSTAQEMLDALERQPAAPPSRVAAWMQDLVGHRLEASAKRVRELQSSSIGPGRPAQQPRALPSWPLAIGAAALLVLGAAAAIAAKRAHAPAEEKPQFIIAQPEPPPELEPPPPPPPTPPPVVEAQPAPAVAAPPAPAPPKRRAKAKGCTMKPHLDDKGRTVYHRECR